MTATVMVWVLMTISYHNVVQYSPPMKTVENCLSAQKALKDMGTNGFSSSRCVQMEIYK